MQKREKGIRQYFTKEAIYFVLFYLTLSFVAVTLQHEISLLPEKLYSFLGRSRFPGRLFSVAVLFAAVHYLTRKFFKPAQINAGSLALNIVLMTVIWASVFLKFKIASIHLLSNVIIGILIFYYLSMRGVFDRKIEKIPSKRDNGLLVLSVTCAFLACIVYFMTSAYHRAFNTTSLDLGYYVNIIWQASRNIEMFCWNYPYGLVNAFSYHIEPAIFLLAPVFRLHCSPELLLALQAIAAYASPLLLYVFMKKMTGKPEESFLISLAFAVSPYLVQSVNFDFHFAPFYIPFVIMLFYFAEFGGFFRALPFALLCVCFREDIAIYISFIYLYFFIRKKDLKYLAGAAVFMFYAYAAIKYISVSHPFGHTFVDEPINMITEPLRWITWNKMALILVLFSSVLILPALPSLQSVLILYPVIGIYLLADRPVIFENHYNALVLPVLFVTFAYYLRGKTPLNREQSGGFMKSSILVFITAIMLHAGWNPPFSNNLFSCIAVFMMLVFILPLAMITAKNAYLNVAAALIVLSVFSLGFVQYNEFKTQVSTERQAEIRTLVKAADKEPVNIPVISNLNIGTHLCCRDYNGNLEFYNQYQVFNIILRNNIKRFMVLADKTGENAMIDRPRQQKGLLHYEGMKMLAPMLGFGYKIMAENKNAVLAEFSKIEK